MRIKLTRFAKVYFGLFLGGLAVMQISRLFSSLAPALFFVLFGMGLIFFAQVYLVATFIINAIKTIVPDKPKQELDQDH